MAKYGFIKKLKKLGVYDKWLDNTELYYGEGGAAKLLAQSCSWEVFMIGSFCFAEAPGGFDFWYKIYES
jgi:hypothetical protein